MPLPTFTCPNCRASYSLDVALADDAAREAVLSICAIHPAGDAFIKPLLRYIALFAPAKNTLSHARMSALIDELAPQVRDAKLTHKGKVFAAPLAYWQAAINTVLAHRDEGRLELPLKTHGYLYAVVASFAAKTEAAQENLRHEQHAGRGLLPGESVRSRELDSAKSVGALLPRLEMPAEVREQISTFKRGRGGKA